MTRAKIQKALSAQERTARFNISIIMLHECSEGNNTEQKQQENLSRSQYQNLWLQTEPHDHLVSLWSLDMMPALIFTETTKL